MRKIFFLVLLFSVEVAAQNYQALNSQREYYYHVPYFTNAYPESAAIKIDSVILSGNDSILYPFKIFGEYEYPPGCYNTIDTSWLGARIIARMNGNNIFYNRAGDSLVIKTNASVTDTWHFIDSINGSYFEATLTSVSYLTVLGSGDSVKTITLQAKNSSGNNIAHIFNGKQILLGKNSGLIRCYNFHLFPTDTTAYLLKGITNPSLGAQNITTAEIYDFNPGDVFQFSGTFGCGPFGSYGITHAEDSVISKTVSVDTLTYVIHTKYYRVDYYNGPNIWSYEMDHTDNYVLSQWGFLLDQLPRQRAYFLPWTMGYSDLIFDIPLYNGRQMKVVNELYHPFPSVDCASEVIGWCIYLKETFAKGLGRVVGYESQGGQGDSLVYYKKGSEIWGTPLNWSAILGTGMELKKDFISVHPNPFSDFISIDLPENTSSKINVLLINQLGQVIFSRSFANQNHIEFSTKDISQGAYILTLTDGRNNYHYKLIK